MPDLPRRRVAVALGSNLGDRHAALDLRRRTPLALSSPTSAFPRSSKPIPKATGLETQPLYLNAVAVGETELAARELLDALLAIEQRLRPRAAVSRARPARSISI